MSYQTIAFSTPSRKKRKYHGINYCLSDRDAFRDSQLTRIQNSCLSSERASHCSTVTTPRKTSRMPWGQHRRTPRRTPQKHQQLRELHRNKKLQARRERVRREAGAQSKAGTREGEETAVTTQGSNINGKVLQRVLQQYTFQTVQNTCCFDTSLISTKSHLTLQESRGVLCQQEQLRTKS